LAGVLFAVPVLSILQSLFLHFKNVALGAGEGGDEGDAPAATVEAEGGSAP
jgi:hypothetical protein